jgi:hypothetical protein
MVDESVDPAAEQSGDPFAWYLRNRHQLIRRHEEVLTMHPDQSASWELRVDLELPTKIERKWEKAPGEYLFPFPLVFLKKAEQRVEFSIRNELGEAVPVPIRKECDEFSAKGLAHAASDLFKERRLSLSNERLDALSARLEPSFRRVVGEKPYEAALVLAKLREEVGLDAAEKKLGKHPAAAGEVGVAWKEAGLDEVLQMLVEHSLIWVLLKGRPGERRSIFIRERKELEARPVIRWAFGELQESSKRPGVRKRRQRALEEIEAAEGAAEVPNPKDALAIGSTPYGRRKRTISFSALGERIGQPLAWMPFEFGWPTIYAMRCASYHFELRCPSGRTPRDLRVAGGPALHERASGGEVEEKEMPPGSRKTLTSGTARLDVPSGPERDPKGLGEDIWLRITVGIGNGSFPVLWFLAAAITAVMLWLLADSNPEFSGGGFANTEAQVLAGCLLVVPALVSALAIGSNEVPVTQLVGGARILLLITGLSAVAAAAVLANATPFGISAESTWALCAMAATAATLPLGTSWLLSSPLVWMGLNKLDSPELQRRALSRGIAAALFGVLALFFCDEAVTRGALAVYLLFLTVLISVVSNDRAAMKVGQTRHYLAAAFLGVGFICLVLACIELREAIAETPDTTLQTWAQVVAAALLVAAYRLGDLLSWVTERKGIKPERDEVHVSPAVGQAMLGKDRVREIDTLRKRENRGDEKQAEDAGNATGEQEEPGQSAADPQ